MKKLPRPETLLPALALLAAALAAPAVCAQQALRGAPTLRPGDHIAVVVNQELVTALLARDAAARGGPARS